MYTTHIILTESPGEEVCVCVCVLGDHFLVSDSGTRD